MGDLSTIFLGYRLPSGFGEFSIAYRNLSSSGHSVAPILDGPTDLNSGFNLNTIDLDYSNSEMSLGPKWDMRWTVGLRWLFLNFNSVAQQSFNQAYFGSGVLQEQVTNNLWGLGPHAGIEIARHLYDPRWSLFLRTDVSSVFDQTRVGYQNTSIGPVGPITSGINNHGNQVVPIIYVQAGISWQPHPQSNTRFFVGYQYEHYWALDYLPPTGPSPPSTGEIEAQGIAFRATICY